MEANPFVNTEELNSVIRGCVANDRKCQELLYKLYYSTFIRYIHKWIQCPQEAESVLNEGFLRVFKGIHKYSHQGSFEGWVRTIIYHSVADHIKANKKHANVVFAEKDTATQHTDNLSYNHILNVIEETLTPTTKDVFKLATFEGCSHRQIGERLGISEGTSKWHLSTAKNLLRKKLSHLRLQLA